MPQRLAYFGISAQPLSGETLHASEASVQLQITSPQLLITARRVSPVGYVVRRPSILTSKLGDHWLAKSLVHRYSVNWSRTSKAAA